MDRFFAVLALAVLLLPAQAGYGQARLGDVQPVFFSLLFPQLIPPCITGEALLTEEASL